MFFSQKELESVDLANIPAHIAIIPDGNRRWAKARFIPTLKGHLAGADAVVDIVRAAKELGVKILTLYTFSTENWKRPKEEVDEQMYMIEHYIQKYLEKLVEYNIRLRGIGRLDALPESLKTVLSRAEEKTKKCTGFDFVLAINYGGRDEIVRAVQKLTAQTTYQITEESISQHLDTHGLQDPDLLIRTSGEQRISNFLLWQCSYTELYLDRVAWPDFTPKHLLIAIQDFQKRQRRIGGGAP